MTLMANVYATSPGHPTLTGTVAFYDGSMVLGTSPVNNGVASLSIGVVSPGAHSFTAVFSGGGTATTSSSTLLVTPTGPSLLRVARYGRLGQREYLLLSFDSPLDPATAQDVANYSLVGASGLRPNRRKYSQPQAAIYDPASRTVTLVMPRNWRAGWRWTFVVNGRLPGGVTGASGCRSRDRTPVNRPARTPAGMSSSRRLRSRTWPAGPGNCPRCTSSSSPWLPGRPPGRDASRGRRLTALGRPDLVGAATPAARLPA